MTNSLLFGAVFIALWYWGYQKVLTPDSVHYRALGRREGVPRPFNGRVLPSMLCGESLTRWTILGLVCLLGTFPLLVAYTGGAWWFVVPLWAGLPWFRLCVKYPVLTDAPAMLFALAGAVLALQGYIVLAVIAVSVGGLCRETVPVFAALYALSPWLLLGLVAPLISHILNKPKGSQGFRAVLHDARMHHMTQGWTNPKIMLLPWGACLLFLFAPLHWWHWLAVGAAYGQLLVANDAARVYMWSAPVVVGVVVSMGIPAWAVLPVLVIHLFNPWAEVQA